jgi:GH15 family glucan-1,4-alpha-glucosidase
MKRTFLHVMVAAVLFISFSSSMHARPGIRIGYLVPPGELTAEDSAATAWLRSVPSFSPVIVHVGEDGMTLKGLAVAWVHIPDSVAYERWKPFLAQLKALAPFARDGGKLLFTNFAATLPYDIGIESERTEAGPISLQDDWLFDQKGIQGFRDHPVFNGLFGGVFTWDTNVDNALHRVGYFGSRFPKEGKVVGIEKSYVVIESDNKLMIEHTPGKGKAMSIGAFVFFSRPNAKRLHLERFLANTIDYIVTGRYTVPPTYWLQADLVPKSFTISTQPLAPSKNRALAPLSSTPLLFTHTAATSDPYEVAGRRALVMGKERGGIDELWVHPFRVVRDFHAGFLVKDSILWLEKIPARVEVRPEALTRIYTTPYGTLREVTFASLDKPGALVHYALESAQPVTLVIKYRSDLRWMWPYDERALGDVYYGFDEKLGALHVRDISGDFTCVIGTDVPAGMRATGQFSDIRWSGGKLVGEPTSLNQVYHAQTAELNGRNGSMVNVAIVGTDMGEKEALQTYRALLDDPLAEHSAMVKHVRQLLGRSVTITSPDKEFNDLWQWALVGTDRFVAHTPRLGTALQAGYMTTARGWDGAHKISGRPGYAWYFGRDSEWSGFAIDNYGDVETVKRQIGFLQKYQDLTGKIFHELSTSGVVHYDASDATPLYIVLVAHYLRASGDLDFIRKSWSHIQRAMDFLYATDADGDLLIENTNVGHGWVEGGKLWPVHTEFYLAGIWAQTLQDASWMATLLGHTALSRRYAADAATVRGKLENEFYDKATQVYSYGMLKDGTFNPEPTALPAAVMYFGFLDDAKVRPMLERYASDAFTSDWGVRIVSSASRLFDPRGYHYGAIWPLFTGWVSLAEYEYGNSTQAFSHFLGSMHIKNSWALGYVEEVINGSVYTPTGVCPHQCWSETNILHPGIHGMIGWKPDAPARTAQLTPRFPLHWNDVTVNNLRVGSSVVALTVHREARSTTYQLQLTSGAPVTIDLAPEIPEGMTITAASVNGKAAKVAKERKRGALAEPVRVALTGVTEVRLQHAGGVGMIPVVSRPSPGDSSMGYRIVRAWLSGSEYTVDVEGKSGTVGQFDVALFDREVSSVDGGKLVEAQKDGRASVNVRFESAATQYVRAKFVVHLK